MKKIVIIVLVVSIILGVLFWLFSSKISLFNKSSNQGPVTLTYWGLWEDDALIRPLIAKYKQENPSVTVNYVRQSSINYRTRVQTQIRNGQGPDVFRIHNSWLPMFASDVAPAPADIFTLPDYQKSFYPVAEQSFVKNGQILGAPIEIDGLGLYINEDLLNGVGGKIPKNWQEFIDTATKMTVRDATGIKTAGAAMGATGNVDNWSDIVGLLLLQQPGVDLNNLASAPVAEVLKFYTGFVIDPRRKTWDSTLPPSTQMFAAGRLGFYLAPSWRVQEIRAANPNLKFEVVPVPQLSGKAVAWASFWGEAVSKNSKNTEEAWKFIKFLTSQEGQKLGYSEAAKVRLFGEPYSLTNLAPELTQDPIVGAYVNQGPIYKFWYLSSNTFDGDSGINDGVIKYFEDGINATLQGQDPTSVLKTIDAGVKQVIGRYTNPQPPAPTGK